MVVGIVGHEARKFTAEGEREAKRIIRELLAPPNAILVSGHCHLGGVDIWAEEIADELGRIKRIFPPASHDWAHGYKPRNLLIAGFSDRVHVIVVDAYPPGYDGMQFEYCYHCMTHTHKKSGACWTAKQCLGGGVWHVIHQPHDVPSA